MPRPSPVFAICAAFSMAPLPAASASALTPEGINAAEYEGGPLPDDQSAITAKVQILLDRIGASPGVVDGYSGENVEKAVRGAEILLGFDEDGVLDNDVWQRLSGDQPPVIVRHTIADADVSDIVAPLPNDYSELAERDWLGFTSPAEKIAERFHMDIDFLEQLNPDADFAKVGAEIWVVDPSDDVETPVARIVVDKPTQRLLAWDDNKTLVASYPVTIGSGSLPSPEGAMEVKAVAKEPTYSYRPDVNFRQGENAEELTLPPGPNGPVGIVWIDLSKPTYGIHGSPEPAEIDKTFSHGCVRLTNWDALELADLVSAGVPVEFAE
jgi:lipoprotein-anchoring transpeptidase ErfK/SrfK